MKHARLLAAISRTPWMIEEDYLRIVERVLNDHICGNEITYTPTEDAKSSQPYTLEVAAGVPFGIPAQAAPKPRHIGVVPIYGVIVPRASMMEQSSGLASSQQIARTIRSMADNPEIDEIVLDVDSPGGSAAGTPEAAREVVRAAAIKPVTSIANMDMCSAAYFIASGARRIIASPSSRVGSIGTAMMHYDVSEMLKQKGIKPTLIRVPEHKYEGAEEFPLSEDARKHLQHLVDAAYSDFIGHVAECRERSVEDAEASFGRGRTMTARDALACGLVDSIGTFDDFIAGVTAPSASHMEEAMNEEKLHELGFESEESLVAFVQGAREQAAGDTEAINRLGELLRARDEEIAQLKTVLADIQANYRGLQVDVAIERAKAANPSTTPEWETHARKLAALDEGLFREFISMPVVVARPTGALPVSTDGARPAGAISVPVKNAAERQLTERALALAKEKGISFADAYKQVAF